METKVKNAAMVAAKETAKVKSVTPAANVEKIAPKESSYKVMLNWHKANKANLYSLSGAIKNLDFSDSNGIRLLFLAKLEVKQIDPAFVLKNITKVKGFSEIQGKIFQSVYRNKVKTEVEKSKWSLWDIVRTIRATIPE